MKDGIFFGVSQGCQLVYLHTKNPSFGILAMALKWKHLLYFMVIW
jgi:hypothetical protein